MDQDTLFIASFGMDSPPCVAGAPLREESSSRSRQAHAKSQEACAAEIPLRRTGTGCVLMLESLVMALVRRITLKDAAAILRNCDSRLWRLVEAEPDSGSPRADRPGCRGPKCLDLFYDLESSFTLKWGDRDVEQAQAGRSAEKNVAREGVDADAIEFAKALLAAIEALITAAGQVEVVHAIKKSSARGRVSAEAAMLYPSQSRAPP